MKKSFLRFTAALLAVLMIAGSIPAEVLADENTVIREEMVSDESYEMVAAADAVEETTEVVEEVYSESDDDLLERILKERSYDKYASGSIPSDYIPDAISKEVDDDYIGASEVDAIPESYSSVSENKISGIRNQSPFGSCWAHAIMATAESADIRLNETDKNVTDYSEMHIVNFFTSEQGTVRNIPDMGPSGDINFITNGDSQLKIGGNPYMASETLFSWVGPVEEWADAGRTEKDQELEHIGKDWYDKYLAQYISDLKSDKEPLAGHIYKEYFDALFNSVPRKESEEDEDWAKRVYEQAEQNEDTKDAPKLQLKINPEREFEKKDNNLQLKNAYFLNRVGDADEVKKKIMELGGGYFTYGYSGQFDSDSVKAYRNEEEPESGDTPSVYYLPKKLSKMNVGTGGHAVTVVGWDDNYPRENFMYTVGNYRGSYIYYVNGVEKRYYTGDENLKPTLEKALLPENNGAWLIKNSWGDDYGEAGYFWISYEDGLAEPGVVFYDWETKNGDEYYDHNYQYDGTASIKTISGKTLNVGATYTISENSLKDREELEAVGLAIGSVDTQYTVKVYTDLEDEMNPESGKLASTSTGKVAFAGYITIPLDNPVVLNKGEKYGVVVNLTSKSSSEVALFVDTSWKNDWIGSNADTENDRTFVLSGDEWKHTSDGNYTVKLKAFTKDTDEGKTIPEAVNIASCEFDPIDAVMYQGYSYNADTKEKTPVNALPKLDIYDVNGKKLIQGTDFDVAPIEGKNSFNPGEAFVNVTGNGGYTGSAEVKYEIVKGNLSDTSYVGIDRKSEILWNNGAVSYDELLDVFRTDGEKEYILTKGKDYTVTVDKDVKNVGTYTATIKAEGNGPYTGTVTRKFNVIKANIKDLSESGDEFISVDVSPATYTGKQVKPAVTVKLFGTVVDKNNYSITYGKNVNAGENAGKVTITGKGNLTGKITKTFTINPKSITGIGDYVITVGNVTYTGQELKPRVTLKYKGKTLKAGTDYNVDYANNTEVGEYAQVTVLGIGNYGAGLSKNFKILPINIAAKDLAVNITKAISGNAVIAVSTKGKEIPADAYQLVITDKESGNTVSENQIVSGKTYSVVFSLKDSVEGKHYKTASSITKTVVCKADVADLTVSVNGIYTYKGSAIKPPVTVTDSEGNKLKNKTDYTISYGKNVNAGTGAGTVTITGKGAYQGKKTVSFDIARKAINPDISKIKDVTYTGKVAVQKPVVKVGKKTLKVGKDYKVSISSDCIDVNTDPYNAYIEFSKNYSLNEGGGIISEGEGDEKIYYVIKDFHIKPAAITAVNVKGAAYVDDEQRGNKLSISMMAGKIKVPVVIDADIDNDENDDFDENGNAVDPTIETDAYSLNEAISLKKLGKKTYKITGKGNFKGTKSFKVNVVKEPLKGIKIPAIADVYSNGAASISINEMVLDSRLTGRYIVPTDYDTESTDGVTISYSKNNKTGKATVTWKAKANSPYYKGSVSKTFKVVAYNFGSGYNATRFAKLDGIMDKEWTGSGITFGKAFIKEHLIRMKNAGKFEGLYGGVLSSDKSIKTLVDTCKISYKDNINPGYGYVILTLGGNYKGQIYIPMEIERAGLSEADYVVNDNQTIKDEEGNITGYVASLSQDGGKLKIESVTLKGVNLTEKDYVVSYLNCKKVTGDDDYAVAVIRGIGKYTGSVSVYYTVVE